MVAVPATNPSAGVAVTSSSTVRRRRWAAIANPRYSTKLPGSTRSAMFSRTVRRPLRRRAATASGRAASASSACRSSTSCRSARGTSRSTVSAPTPATPRTAPPDIPPATPAATPAAALCAASCARSGRRRTSDCPATTVSPTPTSTASTVPTPGERTGCSIFMDSSASSSPSAWTGWPASTATCTTVAAIGATTSRGSCVLAGAMATPALTVRGWSYQTGAADPSRRRLRSQRCPPFLRSLEPACPPPARLTITSRPPASLPG